MRIGDKIYKTGNSQMDKVNGYNPENSQPEVTMDWTQGQGNNRWLSELIHWKPGKKNVERPQKRWVDDIMKHIERHQFQIVQEIDMYGLYLAVDLKQQKKKKKQ